jgi:hypothetical protein
VIRGQVFTADGTLQGGEFLVNTITDGGGILPSAAGLSDGGFVVTWHDSRGTGGDTNASAVRGQVFNADGSQRGGEFLANTTTKFAQTTPDVAALADGGFVVTWTDGSATGGDQDATAIRGQVYAADGSPEGGEFLVNTTTRDSQEIPSVTGLPDNGFVVTWEDRTVFTDNIGGQYFDADRTPRGEEFILTSEDANGRVPSVADFSNGHLVVVWANRTDTSGIDVVGQVFEAPEPEFTLTSADIADQVSATYLGYYGRAPEPAGFRFWQDEHDRLAATGRTDIDVLVNFASRFAEVEESLANLPFLANPTAERADAFVNNVYQQLFNRDAEAAGEDFFSDKLVDQLAAGQPIGDTVLSIMTGARNEDAATLQNKLAVATAFAETLSQAEFDALSDSVLTAREVVADVTADTATRDAALAEIETLTTTGVSTSDGVFG